MSQLHALVMPIIAAVAVVVLIVVAIVMMIPVSSPKLKHFLEDIYGDNDIGETVCSNGAKVVLKRIRTVKQMPDYKILCIKFELPNGVTAEFAIRDKQIYDDISVGDVGSLYYVGNRFIEFKNDRSL